MIAPTKGIAPERALLSVAAQASIVLTEPMTVSQVWSELGRWRARNENLAPITYGWFVLALDVLYALGAIRLEHGLLHKNVST